MSGFPILDLVLGLFFIFFVLSIISSSVVEVILTRNEYRDKVLTKWLFTIFDKQIIQPDGKIVKLGQAIADHCMTTALTKTGQATSFIDSKNFVSALIEKVSFDPDNPGASVITGLDELIKAIEKSKALDGTSMLSTELRRTVLILATEAKVQAEKDLSRDAFQIFRQKMENWFDTNMDRISGTLKKKYARPFTFIIGLVVAVAMNADTISMARYLYEHEEEAKVFAEKASVTAQYLQQQATDTARVAAGERLNIAVDSLRATLPKGMPLGWSKTELHNWFDTTKEHWIGWLVTVFAILLGAPFWFDLLNKIANIRGSGSRPASATDQQRALPGKQ